MAVARDFRIPIIITRTKQSVDSHRNPIKVNVIDPFSSRASDLGESNEINISDSFSTGEQIRTLIIRNDKRVVRQPDETIYVEINENGIDKNSYEVRDIVPNRDLRSTTLRCVRAM